MLNTKVQIIKTSIQTIDEMTQQTDFKGKLDFKEKLQVFVIQVNNKLAKLQKYINKYQADQIFGESSELEIKVVNNKLQVIENTINDIEELAISNDFKGKQKFGVKLAVFTDQVTDKLAKLWKYIDKYQAQCYFEPVPKVIEVPKKPKRIFVPKQPKVVASVIVSDQFMKIALKEIFGYLSIDNCGNKHFLQPIKEHYKPSHVYLWKGSKQCVNKMINNMPVESKNRLMSLIIGNENNNVFDSEIWNIITQTHLQNHNHDPFIDYETHDGPICNLIPQENVTEMNEIYNRIRQYYNH